MIMLATLNWKKPIKKTKKKLNSILSNTHQLRETKSFKTVLQPRHMWFQCPHVLSHLFFPFFIFLFVLWFEPAPPSSRWRINTQVHQKLKEGEDKRRSHWYGGTNTSRFIKQFGWFYCLDKREQFCRSGKWIQYIGFLELFFFFLTMRAAT